MRAVGMLDISREDTSGHHNGYNNEEPVFTHGASQGFSSCVATTVTAIATGKWTDRNSDYLRVSLEPVITKGWCSIPNFSKLYNFINFDVLITFKHILIVKKI